MVPDLPLATWLAIIGVTVVAGFVKGAVGFAMPMIMISGLGSLLEPKLALGALILPTLMSNGIQALRSGLPNAIASAKRHVRYIVIVLVMIALSSQLVNLFSPSTLFLVIGIPVVLFAVFQLLGYRLVIEHTNRFRAELAIGGTAGFVGGLSGVWGPPTVIYLTALDTPKAEQMRVQGIVYGLAAVELVFAHMHSGVFSAKTAPLSAALLIPAFAGTMIGLRFSDSLNQALFRRATLIVLILAGANLVRRGLMG